MRKAVRDMLAGKRIFLDAGEWAALETRGLIFWHPAVPGREAHYRLTDKGFALATENPSPKERLAGGKAAGMKPSDFDPDELRRGTLVEREHTPSFALAREIAMDHLAEDPAYYRKLATVHHDELDDCITRMLAFRRRRSVALGTLTKRVRAVCRGASYNDVTSRVRALREMGKVTWDGDLNVTTPIKWIGVVPARRNPKRGQSKKEARSEAWSLHRSRMRRTKDEDADAKARRRSELAEAAAACAAEHAKAREGCRSRRADVRARAHKALAKSAARRVELRRAYAFEMGRPAPSWERSYSRSESDSLAEHNVPPELLSTWRAERKRFSYDLPPDERAVKFLEWYEENKADVDAERWAAFELSPREYKAAEARYYAEQGADVPF